ncbi:MAG: hypothetical protein AAF639_38470, partial [Chloroflexota bacterium]
MKTRLILLLILVCTQLLIPVTIYAQTTSSNNPLEPDLEDLLNQEVDMGAFPKYVKSGRERGLRLLEKEERMSGEIKHENVPTTREKLRAKKKE